MIINTNMAALNTTRQLGINEKNTQSSLAKLSSGLRINSAADDAAGLAISEKMRGQIRGLNQASSNAQNGISMVSTAEANLNETTSILQRMKELATNAASDTNTPDDRDAMQKEMNQLTSEINRIGNTAEFNTQKLLNGGAQVVTNATVSGALLKNGAGVVTNNETVGTFNNGTNATAATLDASAAAVLTYDANTAPINADAAMNIKIDGTTYTVNSAALKATLNGSQTIAGVEAMIGNAVDAHGNLLSSVANVTDVTGTLKIATKSQLGTGSAVQVNYTGSVPADATAIAGALKIAEAATAAGTNATQANQTLTFTAVPTEGASFTLSDGKKVAFYNSSTGAFKTVDDAKTGLGADYAIDLNGHNANVTAVATAVVAADSTIKGYSFTNLAGVVTITSDTAGALASTTLATAGTDVATATSATGFISFSDAPKEGSSISIGGKTIGFYDSSLQHYTNDVSAKSGLGTDLVVDVKGLTASQVVDKLVSDNPALNAISTNSVSLSKELVADGSVKLNVTATATGFGGDLIGLSKSADTTAGFKATFQIGANTGQTMMVDMTDMRSQALGISGTTAGATMTAANGSKAVLTQVKTASNGSDNNNIEYTLDLSTAGNASAAISIIDDATAKVSAERAKLGAYQNRLEHTINNLQSSSQNITSAEASIRDVDMASEMTNFQKNNILQQAAQAMLAQANQQGQGVLQLLR